MYTFSLDEATIKQAKKHFPFFPKTCLYKLDMKQTGHKNIVQYVSTFNFIEGCKCVLFHSTGGNHKVTVWHPIHSSNEKLSLQNA